MLKHGHNQVNKPTGQACIQTIVDKNNVLLLLLIQNHVLTLIITNNKHVTVIINAKKCAWLMALLTKIMRCILQVRTQEQPYTCPCAIMNVPTGDM